MKKIILLVLFIFLAASSVCFADGFDIGLSGVFASNNQYTLYGGGLNLAGTIYFGRSIVGIGLFGNIFYVTGDADAILGNALFGPVFRVVNGKRFALPISVGFYAGLGGLAFSDDVTISPDIGIGLNITPQVRLGRRTHFYARLQSGLDFLHDFEFDFILSTGIGFSGWR